MKKLMLGNQAIAQGLYDAGVNFVSSYPGTPSTEITEFAAKFDSMYTEWAPNEKVALESAFGASLAGTRSFCGMKHVGLNVAADPLFTLSYTGVNAGLVIGVADDPGMHSSQNEQDSRYYALSSLIPMLEPSDSQESYDFSKIAFSISEEFDTPVLLKTCTRVAHTQSLVETGERIQVKGEYRQNPEKYVMVPAMAKQKHPIVEERLDALRQYSNHTPMNFIDEGSDNSKGFIADSTSYQYIKEVFGDKFPVLKIGMVYPLPDEKIKAFADSVDEIIICEELGPFIETQVKALGVDCVGKEIFSSVDEFSQRTIAQALKLKVDNGVKFPENIPNRPPTLCSGCPHRGIFYTLKKLRLNVFGDIGCYTLGMQPPLGALHTALCMGASVSGLHGFYKGGGKDSVAVIGDSTFIHSGITGLIDISYNQSNSTVIILDNSITGMTGHQNNPANGLNIHNQPAGKVDLVELCKSVGINNIRIIDPYDLKETEKVIAEEVNAEYASVIISRRPCVLLKSVKMPGPILINQDKCIKCLACMKIGCPSISFDGDTVSINPNLCVGCGVCAQLCRKEAIND